MAVNLPFEYVRKSLNYDASGSPSELVVYLNVNGQETPFFLSAEHEKKSNTELFDLVMESIYQVNFPMRAENEKFNLLGTKIAEVDKAIEASKTQSATSQKALLDMVGLFYGKGLLTDEDLTTINL
ncbi:DUF1366 domain-containing protein [Streptococcus uberis]|uniref:DUF1366 domain-containing protein n=1 Tax=Streptococcus uberis TaxID=1349 RepID=UPI000E0783E4|nr:DUF1366 domain-containing protein [Streptococcus uberis]SUO88788.1 Protein of uncharacterised function (DUF1366) [Streptococcus uberis]